MYIMACGANFCHLPDLGQVCHFPRKTSGSDGTLDRGPCLALVGRNSSRGTSGSTGTLDWAQCGQAPSPPATPMPPTPLLAPWHPLPAPDAPTALPLGVLGLWTGAQCGWTPTPPATPNAPTLLTAPNAPTPPTSLRHPWCP